MTFPADQVCYNEVSTTAAIVAYARGYRAGPRDGFAEAVEKIRRDTEKGFD